MTEDQLEARAYTFCSATYRKPLTWHQFLIGTPSRREAASRAQAFAEARSGKPDSLTCYPRNYIREAHSCCAGMHD